MKIIKIAVVGWIMLFVLMIGERYICASRSETFAAIYGAVIGTYFMVLVAFCCAGVEIMADAINKRLEGRPTKQ